MLRQLLGSLSRWQGRRRLAKGEEDLEFAVGLYMQGQIIQQLAKLPTNHQARGGVEKYEKTTIGIRPTSGRGSDASRPLPLEAETRAWRLGLALHNLSISDLSNVTCGLLAANPARRWRAWLRVSRAILLGFSRPTRQDAGEGRWPTVG